MLMTLALEKQAGNQELEVNLHYTPRPLSFKNKKGKGEPPQKNSL